MNTPKNFDWRKYVEECFRSTFYCALATQGQEGVWANPVYFAYDQKWNLYFISQDSSRHMRNIDENEEVAIAVFRTDQKPGGDVCGVQLAGRAVRLTDEEVPAACNIYYRRSGAAEAIGETVPDPGKHMGESAVWKFVKIVPRKIYYFDTRFFGEERQGVPLEAI